MKGTRERRVTLALKWHYLDNNSPKEIVKRFQREGYDITSVSTVRNYLNEEPKEAVLEQIEKKHAEVRLQVAEREEQLYRRARESEEQATKDEPIVRVVPRTRTSQNPQEIPAWEFVDDPDERPDWAEERDVIIRFLDHTVLVEPGDPYPEQAFDGSPRYTKELAGVRRDQPDLDRQRAARREQSQHLQAKGEILGAYEQNINLNADVESELSVEFDAGTAAAIREATLQEDGDE